MLLSSMYHTFSCRSERDFWSFLTYDLLGISLSLLAIYLSGIYYAFWCHKVGDVFGNHQHPFAPPAHSIYPVGLVSFLCHLYISRRHVTQESENLVSDAGIEPGTVLITIVHSFSPLDSTSGKTTIKSPRRCFFCYVCRNGNSSIFSLSS